MPKSDLVGDISFILYIVPIAISAIYGGALWVQAGLGAVLPQSAYLGVTKSPYVFLAGFAAVLLAATLDVNNNGVESRHAEIFSVSRRVQKLALVCFVLALATAWYATGFSGDTGAIIFTVLSGRYAMVFPALLVIFSFLILPTLRIQRRQVRSLAAVACLLAVPAVIYEVGKTNIWAGFGISLLLVIIALFLIVSARRRDIKSGV